jgi:hypothetical protein
MSVRKFVVINCIPVLPRAPYSPDLSPCDSYFFQKLKLSVKDYHFKSFDSVQNAVTHAIKTLKEAEL